MHLPGRRSCKCCSMTRGHSALVACRLLCVCMLSVFKWATSVGRSTGGEGETGCVCVQGTNHRHQSPPPSRAVDGVCVVSTRPFPPLSPSALTAHTCVPATAAAHRSTRGTSRQQRPDILRERSPIRVKGPCVCVCGAFLLLFASGQCVPRQPCRHALTLT